MDDNINAPHRWPDHAEIVAAQTAISGWRRLRIVNFDGTMRFSGLNTASGSGRYFDATATRATCALGLAHHAPQWLCSCGWYACETAAIARELTRETRKRNDVFDAQVQLGGEIIESEYGWRSEWQQIDAVAVTATCHCGAPSTHLRHTHPLDKHAGTQRGGIEHVGSYIAVCETHTAPTPPRRLSLYSTNIEHAVTLQEASDQLGVPVTATAPATSNRRERSPMAAIWATTAVGVAVLWLATAAAANIVDAPLTAPATNGDANMEDIANIGEAAAGAWPDNQNTAGSNLAANVDWVATSTVAQLVAAGADNIEVTSAGPNGLDIIFDANGTSYRLTITDGNSDLTTGN